MSEEDIKKIQDIVDNDKTDGIWMLSILILLILNKSDSNRTIININVGVE